MSGHYVLCLPPHLESMRYEVALPLSAPGTLCFYFLLEVFSMLRNPRASPFLSHSLFSLIPTSQGK